MTEPAHDDGPQQALLYRLKQQSLLAEFGRYALQGRELADLLQRATECCAQGMATDLCKLLEYRSRQNDFIVRAGVGWAEGVVGHAIVGADLASPAGYALKTDTAVISNHLNEESRFRTPLLMAEHGVRRAINVIVQGDGQPFGVLEVDSASPGRFEQDDLAFMQGFAGLLGLAIDRYRVEDERDDALARLHRERECLRKSEEEARAIVAGAADYAIVTTDTDGGITSWSPGAVTIFGWTTDAILGQHIAVLFTPEDREAEIPERECDAARRTSCGEDERWHLRQDGSRFWASGSIRPLHDANGGERGFLKILRDATQTREAAEILTREVSHRVKNSLAMVASLLTLQARASSDPAVRQVLQDAQTRVSTIAAIHDQLWQGSDVLSIDLSTFLPGLCEKLQQTAPPNHRIVCEAAAVVVPADRAVPLGLLVNELVTNALKYAYPPEQGGTVQVTLSRIEAGRLRLDVADAGCGLPEAFDTSRPKSGSLGTRLIMGFSGQLGGVLTAAPNNPGTRFTIEMPGNETKGP